MKSRFANILIGLALGGALYAPAYGRTLSPGAGIMIAKQQLGQPMMKITAKDKTAVTDDSETVSAYIILDDAGALPALEALGVHPRHNHGDFYTATIPVDKLRQVGETPGVGYVSIGSQANLLNDYARAHDGVDDVHANTDNILPSPYTGKGVVVGIIDTGVEYAHTAFRNADGTGTRIKAVWDQSSRLGIPPADFGYGTELTTEEEMLNVVYDSSSEYHGTHTMGIAAGGDMKSKYYGVAPDADIVFVSFKSDDTNIADAIKYIFDYADKVDKPCVINMSLGQHIGPHNGTSFLDRLIDESTGPGRIIVGAAGNEGNVRLHTSKTFTADDTQLKSMLTVASGSNHKLHYLDIWGATPDNIKVKLCVAQSLKGKIIVETPEIDTGNLPDRDIITMFYLDEVGAASSVITSGEINPLNGQPHVMVECSVKETTEGRVMGVIVEGTPGQTVDIWNYSGNEFSSNDKAGWNEGTTEGTVGEIGGTAKRIISVGSYDSRDRIYWSDGYYSEVAEVLPYQRDHRSVFSSCGPTADGRCVPNILAAGCPVISAINRHAYNSMGMDLNSYTSSYTTDEKGVKYYYSYNMGTSMAAPFVAGTVALMLEANPMLTPEDVKQMISSTAETDSYMGTLPNNQYGYGRINSLECVKAAVRLSGLEPASVVTRNGASKAWGDNAGNLVIAVPGLEQEATAAVYTASGTMVGRFTLNEPITTIDASTWGKGVFVVTVKGESINESFKVAL